MCWTKRTIAIAIKKPKKISLKKCTLRINREIATKTNKIIKVNLSIFLLKYKYDSIKPMPEMLA
jgi:hypothetical protein